MKPKQYREYRRAKHEFEERKKEHEAALADLKRLEEKAFLRMTESACQAAEKARERAEKTEKAFLKAQEIKNGIKKGR